MEASSLVRPLQAGVGPGRRHLLVSTADHYWRGHRLQSKCLEEETVLSFQFLSTCAHTVQPLSSWAFCSWWTGTWTDSSASRSDGNQWGNEWVFRLWSSSQRPASPSAFQSCSVTTVVDWSCGRGLHTSFLLLLWAETGPSSSNVIRNESCRRRRWLFYLGLFHSSTCSEVDVFFMAPVGAVFHPQTCVFLHIHFAGSLIGSLRAT